MEDKQAIEAITKMFPLEPNESPSFIATQILLRLASLGYVKLAEQKLPDYKGESKMTRDQQVAKLTEIIKLIGKDHKVKIIKPELYANEILDALYKLPDVVEVSEWFEKEKVEVKTTISLVENKIIVENDGYSAQKYLLTKFCMWLKSREKALLQQDKPEKPCPHCIDGKVTYYKDGQFEAYIDCPSCHGTGRSK